MTIRSHPFGGVALSGSDARRFHQQLSEPANPLAAENVRQGVALARAFREAGRVLTLPPRSPP